MEFKFFFVGNTYFGIFRFLYVGSIISFIFTVFFNIGFIFSRNLSLLCRKYLFWHF
jgi:hypothetical protein